MSDFKGVLIEDSRLQLTDEIKFGVLCGSAQSNFQPYNSVSTSNTNVNFNINVGSENLVVDRHLLIQADLTFRVNCGGPSAPVPVDELAFNWGWSEGFGSFPIQSLMQSCSCTINNTTITNNVIDILAMVIRLNDNRVLSSYNSTTASMPDDAYANYADGVGAGNNPLSSFNNSGFDSDFTGRASLKTDITVLHLIDGDPANTDTSLLSTSAADTWVITITSNITEPFVCMSPWISMSPSDDPGLMGINNITFNMQLDSTMSRVLRTANCAVSPAGGATTVQNLKPTYITSVVPGSATQPLMLNNCKLLFNFLSMQPDQAARLKSSRNIVSYLEYPRFLSTATTNPIIPSGGKFALQTQSNQFNLVNDLILIAVRQPMSNQSYANSDSWLAIDSISISYNNQSGILASATKEQLFNISKRNGSGQNFQEFGGFATNGNSGLSDPTLAGATKIGTTGSLLVLCPALDFNLDPSLASSSLGQFQFQATINVVNQYSYNIQPEIIIVCVNSGIFCTMNGTSEIQKGILTRDMVLKVKEESPANALTTKELERLVGGKMVHRGMFNTHPLLHHHKHHKHHAKHAPMEAGIMSGGIGSGGVSHHSGGRLHKYKK